VVLHFLENYRSDHIFFLSFLVLSFKNNNNKIKIKIKIRLDWVACGGLQTKEWKQQRNFCRMAYQVVPHKRFHDRVIFLDSLFHIFMETWLGFFFFFFFF
jgi:hypothetical protein